MTAPGVTPRRSAGRAVYPGGVPGAQVFAPAPAADARARVRTGAVAAHRASTVEQGGGAPVDRAPRCTSRLPAPAMTIRIPGTGETFEAQLVADERGVLRLVEGNPREATYSLSAVLTVGWRFEDSTPAERALVVQHGFVSGRLQ
jgi:hypothetical protein